MKKRGAMEKLTSRIIIKKLEKEKNKLKERGVKKIGLFGSYAKDNQTSSSDIDFLVEFEEGRWLFDDFIHLVHFLKDLLGKGIDLGEEHLLREELKSYILEGEKVEAKI